MHIKHTSKLNYESVNYLRNSEAKSQYISIMPKNEQTEHAICHTLVNVFNSKSYQFITQTNEIY